MASTRSSFHCPIFGYPKDLSKSVLPTYGDISRFYNYLRQESEKKNAVITKDYLEVIADRIEELWGSESIPTVSRRRILRMLTDYYEEVRKKLKNKTRSNFSAWIKEYAEQKNMQLFDITACKCADMDACWCPRENRIPVMEREFVKDQRSVRKMMMAGVDVKETRARNKRAARQQLDAMSSEPQEEPPAKARAGPSRPSSSQGLQQEDFQLPDPSNEEDAKSDPSFELKSAQKSSLARNIVSVERTAKICDRYGVSDRAAAAIGSAVLMDFGLVTEEDRHLVIDRSKIRRARQMYRSTLQEEAQAQAADIVIQAIYFDGRKDMTLFMEEEDGKWYRKRRKEEHISLVQEPGGEYIGHCTPESGSGVDTASSLIDYCEDNGISLSNIKVCGCDGTPINTGPTNGTLAMLEKSLGHSVHWFICQLHGLELLVRHMIIKIDGPTKSGTTYSGPIGALLPSAESLPVVSFSPIRGELPNLPPDVRDDLSTDQQYFFDIASAVHSGECPPDLARRDPGNMSQARWMTTASRMLRLYVSQPKPSADLKMMVKFIMTVYLPLWFAVKSRPHCVHGPTHVLDLLHKTKKLPEKLKNIIRPVVLRNAYFGHPENVLLAMLADDRRSVRSEAIKMIIDCRKKAEDQTLIRHFQIPSLNENARDYHELINWKKFKSVSEPPLTKSLSQEELQKITETKLEVPKFPVHTQSVERTVKLVTEAAESVCGQERREGFIRARLQCRKEMPVFETKHEFVA